MFWLPGGKAMLHNYPINAGQQFGPLVALSIGATLQS